MIIRHLPNSNSLTQSFRQLEKKEINYLNERVERELKNPETLRAGPHQEKGLQDMLEDLKAPAEVKNKDERVNLSEVEENFHVTQSFPVENLGKYLKTVVEEDGVRFESGLEVRDEGEMVGKLMVLSNLEDTEEILIDQNNYEVGTPIEVQINNHPDHDKEYLAETYYFSPDEMTPDEEGVAYRKRDFDRNVDMGESLT